MAAKGVPALVGGWDKGVRRGRLRGGDLWDQLKMGVAGEGRLQHMFYCRAGGETA